MNLLMTYVVDDFSTDTFQMSCLPCTWVTRTGHHQLQVQVPRSVQLVSDASISRTVTIVSRSPEKNDENMDGLKMFMKDFKGTGTKVLPSSQESIAAVFLIDHDYCIQDEGQSKKQEVTCINLKQTLTAEEYAEKAKDDVKDEVRYEAKVEFENEVTDVNKELKEEVEEKCCVVEANIVKEHLILVSSECLMSYKEA